jgi:hypothetical protein
MTYVNVWVPLTHRTYPTCHIGFTWCVCVLLMLNVDLNVMSDRTNDVDIPTTYLLIQRGLSSVCIL